MANLWNIGAAFRGINDYEQLQAQQAQLKQNLEIGKLKLDELKDATEQAKEQRKAQKEANQTVLDYLARVSPDANTGAPSMPGAPTTQIPQPPPVQAPAPGQKSVPMMQPGQIPQPPQAPPQGPPQGGPQAQPPGPPPGMPPGPPQGLQGPQGAPQGPQMPPQAGPQGQPPIQPYRTLSGPSAPSPQGAAIPPPPQTGEPRPNSMSIQDAAQFIKARGITDPNTSMAILERLNPYLNNEAKQEAAQYKLQLQYAEKMAEVEQRRQAAEQASKDKRYSVDERRDATKEANRLRAEGNDLRRDMNNWRKSQTEAKTGAGGGKPDAEGNRFDAAETAAWNYILKGVTPPAKGGEYPQTMSRVAQIAKENGLTVQELTTASADAKSKLAAKKNFEVRAQNMARAENQILEEIPLAEQAIKGLNISSIPAFQKAGLSALRAVGDPRITRLDQSLTTIFNEFQGIVTGSGGALHVSDVEDAKHQIENARTEKQLTAAIAGIRATMDRAKKAADKTRKEITDDINASFKREKGGGDSSSLPSGWSVKVKG